VLSRVFRIKFQNSQIRYSAQTKIVDLIATKWFILSNNHILKDIDNYQIPIHWVKISARSKIANSVFGSIENCWFFRNNQTKPNLLGKNQLPSLSRFYNAHDSKYLCVTRSWYWFFLFVSYHSVNRIYHLVTDINPN